jgi:hypothetical protein
LDTPSTSPTRTSGIPVSTSSWASAAWRTIPDGSKRSTTIRRTPTGSPAIAVPAAARRAVVGVGGWLHALRTGHTLACLLSHEVLTDGARAGGVCF